MKANTTTAEVRNIWESVKNELMEEGKVETDPTFIQTITKEVRVRLGIEENFIALDKFKKFL